MLTDDYIRHNPRHSPASTPQVGIGPLAALLSARDSSHARAEVVCLV